MKAKKILQIFFPKHYFINLSILKISGGNTGAGPYPVQMTQTTTPYPPQPQPYPPQPQPQPYSDLPPPYPGPPAGWPGSGNPPAPDVQTPMMSTEYSQKQPAFNPNME